MDAEHISGLNIALNEASLLGVEVDPQARTAAATLAVLTLPEVGPMVSDNRLQFLFYPVGRIVASLRKGAWNDEKAEVVEFELADLLSVVQEFGGAPIYGWKFFDNTDVEAFRRWSDRLSLDHETGLEGRTHTIDLFQEGYQRHLDIRIWFDKIAIGDPAGDQVLLDDLIAGGKRWWDGFYNGDARTQGSGLVPLK